MKGIYSKRAKLLYNLLKTTRCEFSVSEMITKLFQSNPSFTEQAVCTCTQSNPDVGYPLVVLNHEIFSNNFLNFERALLENLPDTLQCRKCNNEVECNREFGPHIFIEVIRLV